LTLLHLQIKFLQYSNKNLIFRIYTGEIGDMQLTFQNGNFVLSNHKDLSVINLKAALAFRQYGDEVAERVFKRALNVDYDAPCLPPLSFLDSHQREGIQWILTRSRSYLAHAPGAGKTCQSIVSSLLIPKPGSRLFIVPPTLTLNWQRETVKFSRYMGVSSTVSIVPLSTDKDTADWSSDFIICPDSMITKRWVYTGLLRIKPIFIAVDEASRFKEFTSQRSKAFYGGKHNGVTYPGLFQNALHTVFMDGSPMPNRPMELWAPTFALDPVSIDCLSHSEFGFRYCGAVLSKRGEWEFRGATHQEELKEKIQKKFMHVVTEDKLNHPERLRSILFMSEDVRTPKMKSWEEANLKSLKLSDIDESMNRGKIATYRKELGLKKIKWTVRYIRDRIKERNESILLFAWHREVCEGLQNQLREFDPTIIYGGTSNVEREEGIKAFQDGKRRLLIGNIQSAGRGHNITAATRIVFCEYSWGSELNRQAEKRASRRGNSSAFVRCEYIVVPNSIDEVVLKSVFSKERRVKEIIG
jgi:SWI/SNF-related matrix-associated actin-dependent regulator 1 of chromatin subfamily A